MRGSSVPSACSQRSTLTFKAAFNDLPGLKVRLPPSWCFQLCFLCNAAQNISAFSLSSNKAAGSSHQKFSGQTSYGRKPGGAEEWYPCIATSEDQHRGPSTAEELFTLNTVPASGSPGSLPRKVRMICYTFLPQELNYWLFLKQYTMVLLHQLGNSGTKEITSPL